MKPLAVFPDAERATVDLLTALLDEWAPDFTCGVGVPPDWTPASPTHVRVAWDGTPVLEHPVVAHATVRLVAYAATTTEAKAAVAVAQGLLLAHAGGDGVAAVHELTGVLPAHDPATAAEIASVTVRITVRSVPLEPTGS